ncbi:hypothetical protein HD806DRAFT_70106 [Xylariaceae sp. AK1471]|nr:hypothetical protein HD806DRAFT_70106 [Xylariaceae sp. AK1471]
MKLSLFSPMLMAISTGALKARQLFEFPNATFIENIAVRPNGHILITTFDQAHLFTIDPAAPGYPVITAQVPGKTALTGTTELTRDKYAVAAGIMDNFAFMNGSSSIWLVDFSSNTKQPSLTLAANIPQAASINGIVTLPKHKHVILAIDSAKGVMYRVNTVSGEVDVAFEDELLANGNSNSTGGGSPTSPPPIGANGVKIHDGYLYFTQSVQQFFGRIRISDAGDKIGDVEKIVSVPEGLRAYDDFAMTKGGVSYAVVHPNAVVEVTPSGQQTVIYRPDEIPNLREPTSAALSADERRLYIVTGGNQTNGKVYGGQIVEVELH